jgi:hypothetical protein
VNQQRLPLKREKPTVLSKRNEADASNLKSARIILADRAKYSGIQVEWAEAVIKKANYSRLL